MTGPLHNKLEALRANYSEVVGEPFQHFFCPLLLEDESTELCRAHLINQAFPDSTRRWTVQRADVDNFYGSVFESSFVETRRESAIADYLSSDSSNKGNIRPQLYLKNTRIDYYLPKSTIPATHSEVLLEKEPGLIRLAVKLPPNEVSQTESKDWEFVFEKDYRLEALVSILKAAHLTMFEMLGYRYAFSSGGLFVGHTILGQFFKENRNRSKKEVLTNAANYFTQYANLVRPVLSAEGTVGDTVRDRWMYICQDPRPWAIIVLLRTSDRLHSALVPILDTPDAAARFVTFLGEAGSTLKARKCHFDGHVFQAVPEVEELNWPKANFDCV